MAEAPVVRLDGAAIQIKNLLYVFAGYGTINHVRNLPDMSSVLFLYLHALRLKISSFLQFMSWCFKKGSSYNLLHMRFLLYILQGVIEKYFLIWMNDSSN